jgi:Saf4/Yju2 protein
MHRGSDGGRVLGNDLKILDSLNYTWPTLFVEYTAKLDCNAYIIHFSSTFTHPLWNPHLIVLSRTRSLNSGIEPQTLKMQGFNMGRYHPPASLDKSLSKQPTGSFNRSASGARLISQPTVRFEMPFAIWCTTCEPETIIGQGVRFNARKNRVGNYYSTPIWAFEMRHSVCSGTIEIRTDPRNSEYVVTKGARKRDYGPEDGAEESLLGRVVSADEKDRRAADPFASLEGKVEEGGVVKKENWWVEKLKEDRDRDWDDVWSANRRLRKTFRQERKVLQAKEKDREEITERLALSIDVLDEEKEDGQRAALVSFGESEQSANQRVVASTARPLFQEKTILETIKLTKENKVKSRIKTEQTKALLQHNLRSSTRAVVDPFLNGSSISKSLLPGLKRKRSPNPIEEAKAKEVDEAKPALLVDYTSDESDVPSS